MFRKIVKTMRDPVLHFLWYVKLDCGHETVAFKGRRRPQVNDRMVCWQCVKGINENIWK